MQPRADPAPATQPGPIVIAAAVSAALAAAIAADSWRPPALLAVGIALGVVLAHSTFGFAAAYRNLLLHRRGDGVLAQLLMLAVATALFAPVLAAGSVFGNPISGGFAPVGMSVAAGAFMFGVGMQLAGGCGSGTLFALGLGSGRMVLVLVFFCAGAFWASLDMQWWQALPSVPPVVLGHSLGWLNAAGLQIVVIAVLAAILRRRTRAALGPLLPRRRDWYFGPWPLGFGAIALAVLNLATLLLAGHPWSITWAFTLWGAKAATLAGWEPDAHTFWLGGFQRGALEGSVLDDTTSIMDIGMILGALLAAGLAGRFTLRWRLAARPALAAVLGGALMGYGARIAYGCNVGAFFSGVASTSIHGWLWIAAALAGSAIGVGLRPWFALSDGAASAPHPPGRGAWRAYRAPR